MDYSKERWLKIYTRNTGGWLDLSWQARGLSLEISRYLDSEGQLPLGRKGISSLAGVLRARWDDIKPFVEELVADDRLALLDGNILHEPGYVARQSSVTHPALRKKLQRSRDAVSRDVTPCHAAAEMSRSDQIRLEEIRSEEIRSPPLATLAPPSGGPVSPVVEEDVPEPVTETRRKARGTRLPTGWAPSAETQAWARREGIADPLAVLAEFTDFWAGVPGARGVKLDWEATYRNRLRQVGARPSANRFAKGAEITKQPAAHDAPWMKLPEVG